MTAKQYENWTAGLRRHPESIRVLSAANVLTTGIVYAAYLLYLGFVLLTNTTRLLPAVLIPGISFVLLTLVRDRINAPRPYEVLDIRPLLFKDTKGPSFPSRQVFSVCVIAFTVGVHIHWAGIALGAVGLLISLIRVLAGIHFPRDVLAGMLSGIACGLIGFLILSVLS